MTYLFVQISSHAIVSRLECINCLVVELLGGAHTVRSAEYRCAGGIYGTACVLCLFVCLSETRRCMEVGEMDRKQFFL